jgi:hypothetical protein
MARRRGRPNRQQASDKALTTVDLSDVDPVRILREIASDRSVPATARVAACKALLSGGENSSTRETVSNKDAVTRRALRLLRGGKEG